MTFFLFQEISSRTIILQNWQMIWHVSSLYVLFRWIFGCSVDNRKTKEHSVNVDIWTCNPGPGRHFANDRPWQTASAQTDCYIHDAGEGMFAIEDYAERRLLAPHLLAEPSWICRNRSGAQAQRHSHSIKRQSRSSADSERLILRF